MNKNARLRYAELHATSNFSFLRGASHPQELVETAHEVGLEAIAVTDRNTLSGVVRAHVAAKDAGIAFIVGCQLDLIDGTSLLCYPTDRAAYGRLARLLTLGKRKAGKNECHLTFEDVVAHATGQIFLFLPPEQFEHDALVSAVSKRAQQLDAQCFLAAQHAYRGDDRRRIMELDVIAGKCRTPLVATGGVLYHSPRRRPLQDVLTCIREHCTIETAGFRLEANAERHLKSPVEMARLFVDHEGALTRSVEIAQACRFSLDELSYNYPREPVPAGKSPQQHLEDLTWAGARMRYPDGIPVKVHDTIKKEIRLIAELNFALYFLTVYDIVSWARSRDPVSGAWIGGQFGCMLLPTYYLR